MGKSALSIDTLAVPLPTNGKIPKNMQKWRRKKSNLVLVKTITISGANCFSDNGEIGIAQHVTRRSADERGEPTIAKARVVTETIIAVEMDKGDGVTAMQMVFFLLKSSGVYRSTPLYVVCTY